MESPQNRASCLADPGGGVLAVEWEPKAPGAFGWGCVGLVVFGLRVVGAIGSQPDTSFGAALALGTIRRGQASGLSR